MINELNKDLGGVAMVFDEGPLQCFRFAQQAQEKIHHRQDMYKVQTGRLYSYDYERLAVASEEDRRTVQEMMEELSNLRDFNLPSRRRQRKWSEDTGDVDLDRALEGHSSPYRKMARRRSDVPSNVTLLCNLDAVHCKSHQAIFWRGAMAAALSSMLDDLGYVTTIWSWNTGHSVYKRPYSGQFTAIRLKDSCEDLDPMNLINCLGSWFMRAVMFATFADPGGWQPSSIGGVSDDLDLWKGYLDLQDDHVIQIPIVESKQECITQTLRYLNELLENVKK